MSLDATGTEWEIIAPATVDTVGGTGANTKSWLDLVLEGMIRAGLGIQAICLYLTVSAPELDAWVRRLHLPPPQDVPLRRPAPRRGWTAAEVRQLVDWWGQGIRVGWIAEALGRSKSGIYTKKRRLGLPARDRKSLVDHDLLGATDVCLGGGVEVARVEAPGATKRRKARRSLRGEAAARTSCTSEQEGIAFGLLEENASEPVCGSGDGGCGITSQATEGAAGERVAAFDGDAQESESEHVSAAAVDADGAASLSGEESAGFVEESRENHGSVWLEKASPKLLAAIAQAKGMTRYGCAGRPDWARCEITEDEFYELALRGFAGQTRFGVARDMGISVQAAADRMSRAGIGSVRRGLKGADRRQVEFFDLEVGLEKMRTSGAVARVCFNTKMLHFVGVEERRRFYSSPDSRRRHDPEGKKKGRQRNSKKKGASETPVRSAQDLWQEHLDRLECERKCSQATYSAELDDVFEELDFFLSSSGSVEVDGVVRK